MKAAAIATSIRLLITGHWMNNGNIFKTIIGQKDELTALRVRLRPLFGNEIYCFTDGSKTEYGSG